MKNILNFMTACFKGRINSIQTLLVSVSFFIVFNSCRKNESTVGADFVGNIVGFNVIVSDTASLVAYTAIQDSFPTKSLNYYMLGAMNDPEFGSSFANIGVQVSTPIEGYSYPAGANIDSVILQIAYATPTSYYGNTNTVHNIKVYELDEQLINRFDSLYFSNRNYKVKNEVLGSWSGKFDTVEMGRPKIEVYNGITTNLVPHLRVKIDNPTFIAKLLAAPVGSNSTFQTSFYGFMVKDEISPLTPSEGGMAYFELGKNITVTSMVIYFNGGTQKAAFPMSQLRSLKINQFVHQHSVTIPIQPSVGGTHRDVNYVKPMGGLTTRVLIPHLFDYVKDKNVALTGAELIFTPSVGSFDDVYKLPEFIQLNDADSLGRNKTIRDILLGGSYYGGTFQNGAYRFNITRHVQYLFTEYTKNNKNHNYGLNLIIPADNPVAANRLKLNTTRGGANFKLKLSYAVIK